MTSREAVDLVSKALHTPRTKQRAQLKLGHAGTLDPLATGVLLVCFGTGTRLVPLLHEYSKVYRAQFRLGETSNTDDSDGTVVRHAGTQPSTTEIETILPEFVGRILQRPPKYSALRVAGRRAYELARELETVDLAPRIVSAYRFKIVDFVPPRLDVEVECGSGTYIRSLARDLGERIGTGALMSGLTRVSIGPFHIQDALPISDSGKITREQVMDRLQPLKSAVCHLPTLEVSKSVSDLVRNGGRLAWSEQRRSDLMPPQVSIPSIEGELVSSFERIAIVEEAGDLAAIAEVQTNRLQPRIVFPM